jgi:hypothetical protein
MITRIEQLARVSAPSSKRFSAMSSRNYPSSDTITTSSRAALSLAASTMATV